MATEIHFLLNDQEIKTSEPAGLLALDFLRRRERLVGTKEGCKEGDCGACGVLIGELQDGLIHYKAVTSCLVPLGELHGKHLVTIEGLRMEQASIVQAAIDATGGSQCGFCTPGIVVSLTGQMMEVGPKMNAANVQYALSGHLCRCTGYSALFRAGSLMIESAKCLTKHGSQSDHIKEMLAQQILPDYFLTISNRLRKIPPQSTTKVNGKPASTTFIAGGTDIYVQQGESIPECAVEILNFHPEMRGIRKENSELHVGALTTFEDFSQNALIQFAIPEIQDYMHLIASLQIRNRATLGGNIVNASPIGDMTILLLSLGARLILKAGNKKRSIVMKDFFTGYKQLAKAPEEIVTEIIFTMPDAQTRINYEKVSKRKCLDISSVTSGIRISSRDGKISTASISMGGVAPIPLLMAKTGAFLTGKSISNETLHQALEIAQSEIAPISDIRGSAGYKRLLTRQLIIAHFTKLFPDFISFREFCAAHSL